MALVAGIAAASASAASYTKTFSFGLYGTEEGRFKSARGMDTDAAGNVWIADMEVSRIEEFSPTGGYIATITGSGEHSLKNPRDLAIAPEGNIWVMDSGLKAAVEFKPNGEYLREIKGVGAIWLIAVDSKGNVWLGDPEGIVHEHVYKYNSTGVFQKSVKVPPYDQFQVDSKDNLLVSTFGETGLAQYSSEGSYLGQIGKGVLNEPGEATVDSEGNIWVADYTGSARLMRGFNSKGEYLTQFDPGHQTGPLYSLAAATEGSLWIAFSAVSDQIEKWSPSTAEQLGGLAVTEPFDGGTTSKANYNANWSKLGWAAEKGLDTTTGWRVSGSFPIVNGAFLNSAIADTGSGTAVVATMAEDPELSERYFSAWLDASGSAGTREGYELRFVMTATSNYNVTLSKWKAGAQTVLASKSGYGFLDGNSFALVDKGGTVSAWTNTDSGFTQLLTASDATFASGNAGIEGAGNIARLSNFKAGRLSISLPDTTITGGSSGKVTPDVAFTFSSDTGGATFECALDAGTYAACSSPKSYEGLTEGSHTFKVRAVKGGFVDSTPAERTVEVKEVAKAVSSVAILDEFKRSEIPLANGKWTKTSWVEQIGASWEEPWHGYGSNNNLAGAYWNGATFSDASAGLLVSATVGSGSTASGEYMAVWLDMPSPGSARSGYEARFTGTNGSASAYKVELSKWVSGTRTVLGTKEGFSLPVNTTFVLTETGGKLTLWTGTSSFSRVLSAYDTTYSSGYAGIEVNQGEGTAYNFRAGKVQ